MSLSSLVLSALLATASPATATATATEIAPSPGESAFPGQLWNSLRSSGSPRERALSIFVGNPDWQSASEAGVRAAEGLRLREAADAAPTDPIVQLMWASAAEDRSGCDAAHPCAGRRLAFARLQPDNGAAWMPALNEAEQAGDAARVDDALAKMAKAQRFDDLYVEAWQAWKDIVHRMPIGEAELRVAAARQNRSTNQAREEMELGVATSYAAMLPLGGAIQSLVHACDRARYPKASARRFEDCARVGRLMSRSGTSMITVAIGHALMRRSGMQTQADREAERNFRWTQSAYIDRVGQFEGSAAEMRQYFADLVATGSETRAQELLLARHGIPLQAPSDWKDPRPNSG
jgi:hypothetical protein